MLAPKILEKRLTDWNYKWRAPFGQYFYKRYIPERFWRKAILANLVGMFSHQPNSDSRTFEYPWAFYATDLNKGMQVLDVGGGYSGFSFVLDKEGMNVTVIDPFLKYGSLDHYSEDPKEVFEVLNRAYATRVTVVVNTLEKAAFKAKSFDRIFCISALEHLSNEDIEVILSIIPKILKPNGFFILTVDLFLNLVPFTTRNTNEYGRNVSIKHLLDKSGLELVMGNKNELFGFSTFKPLEILSNLEKYYIGQTYPILTECLVLRKTNENFNSQS